MFEKPVVVNSLKVDDGASVFILTVPFLMSQ